MPWPVIIYALMHHMHCVFVCI